MPLAYYQSTDFAGICPRRSSASRPNPHSDKVALLSNKPPPSPLPPAMNTPTPCLSFSMFPLLFLYHPLLIHPSWHCRFFSRGLSTKYRPCPFLTFTFPGKMALHDRVCHRAPRYIRTLVPTRLRQSSYLPLQPQVLSPTNLSVVLLSSSSIQMNTHA